MLEEDRNFHLIPSSQSTTDADYDPFSKNKVYGSNLLNRPQPEGYSEEWLESLKTKLTDDLVSGKLLLIFRIANEWLALPSYCIKEVTETAFIHRLPHTSTKVLLGIANVQGELLIAISMQAFLSIPEAIKNFDDQPVSRHYIRNIVFGVNNDIFVFTVDEIYGLTQVQSNTFESPPISISKSLKNYFSGVFSLNNTPVGLLDEMLIISKLNEKHL